MLCYIKDFKTFTTLAKYDATSWSLPEGTNGEVVIYQKNPVELTTKYVGMWLIINKELFYISDATPNDDNISLGIQPPIYAFTRQVYYNGQTTYGALISYILSNDYGPSCSDTEYRLSYLSVTNTDSTPCSIDTDDYGYIIPCDIFDDALYNGVAIDFSYSNTELLINIHTANYGIGYITFNDGKTILEAESYDPNFIAKVTVLHRLEVVEEGDPEYEVVDFYLSADNQISTEPPINRAKGIWKYYTAEVDEAPFFVALGAFSHNNNNHKIEFHSPERFHLYQSIKMRLRNEIFSTIITSRVLNYDDDRYYYTCGNLATTLTEKLDTEAEETSTEIISIKKQIANGSGGGGGGGGGGSGVSSVNGRTGAVTLSKTDVGMGNVDNIRQYSAQNQPPYPVVSVNGLTGAVNLPGLAGSGVAVQSYEPINGELIWIDTDDPGGEYVIPAIDDDNVSQYDTWSSSKIVNTLYPVGSIYMSVNNVSPATFFGGTWEQLKDRFLLGAGDTYTAGDTGGEATHSLTENEMPSHYHSITANITSIETSGYGFVANGPFTDRGLVLRNTADMATTNTGGGQAHNNMPPYIVVYMWKRTA